MLRRPDFVACYEHGRRYTSRHFILYVLRRKGSSVWRLGLAVTKKSGPAVSRNRIKRVLREFFRLHQHEMTEPLDIVIVAKRNLQAKGFGLSRATEELLPLLRRVLERPPSEVDLSGDA